MSAPNSYGSGSSMPAMGAGQSNRYTPNFRSGFQPKPMPQNQAYGSTKPMQTGGMSFPGINPMASGMQMPRQMSPVQPPGGYQQNPAQAPGGTTFTGNAIDNGQDPNYWASRNINMGSNGGLSFQQGVQAPGATAQDPYAYLSPMTRAFLGL